MAALAVSGAAALAAVAGDAERIAEAWYLAEVDADGSAEVTEVITYDFGASSRHGIYRDIPGLTPTEARATATVASTTAPDDLTVETAILDGETGARLRIGDPNRTIRQRHAYTITYPHSGVADRDSVAWDAHGAYWDVAAEHVEIHVVGPYQWDSPSCAQGSTGSTTACAISQPEPGHLVATVDKIGSHEGVTVFADAGEPLSISPAAPTVPGAAGDDGLPILRIMTIAAPVALAAAVAVGEWARLRGREEAPVGSAVDVAFHDDDSPAGEVRLIDAADLADLATTEFAAPRGVAPEVGAVVLEESVPTRTFTAWLLEAANRGEVDLEPDPDDGDNFQLRRGANVAAPADEEILSTLFAGRDVVTLGTYDRRVESAGAALRTRLRNWQGASGLWNPAGDRRKTHARIAGGLGIAAGLVIVVVSSYLVVRHARPWWIGGLVVGALATGAAAAAIIRSWELHIRSARGTALWLQVESFRRFLHHSEAEHVERAAEYGLVRQYTAWAIALDETKAWTRAVQAAAVAGTAAAGVGTAYAADLAFASSASAMAGSVSSAVTAPSSSGSGGGSVGGGGGGGGGGSW